MDKDYIVMRASQYSGYVRHTNKKIVCDEAERMAIKYNDKFFVLEVVGSVRPLSKVVWDKG